MNLWNHIDPDYILQIDVKQGEMYKEIGKVGGKVGPTRMKKSDITFDYLASSQLREEAPKNWSPAN